MAGKAHYMGENRFQAKFKAWIYQHAILPRLFWPRLVEDFKQNVSQFLRRWLCLPNSLTSFALYGHTSNNPQ